ncbi:associated with HOX [Streptococcus oralis SK313]|uniref:Associated with HOX n=1 Tax=Streptococcus oralis SK313 TaxID=1035190 RepID=F9Q2N4_STROR|nr:associated with HOX [Streptococcus oralis SK313]
MLSAILSISVLASCSLDKNRNNTEPSSALSSVSKDDKTSVSTEAKAENTSESSTKASQSTAENKKETGQDLYKEVIERYNHFTDLLKKVIEKIYTRRINKIRLLQKNIAWFSLEWIIKMHPIGNTQWLI